MKMAVTTPPSAKAKKTKTKGAVKNGPFSFLCARGFAPRAGKGYARERNKKIIAATHARARVPVLHNFLVPFPLAFATPTLRQWGRVSRVKPADNLSIN
jgi:hypothetical protein